MSNEVLIELGVEELPARFIDDAVQQMFNKTTAWLTDNRIKYEHVYTFATPRRLAVHIVGVADIQESLEEEVRGPSVEIAKDKTGAWTKAAVGFSKGQGKTVDDLYIKSVNQKSYVFLNKKTDGQRTIQLLPEFGEILSSIQFPQTMQWGDQSFKYARPIRWIVALYNQTIIPFEIANVQTGRTTYGHRFLGQAIDINHPSDYETLLEQQYVIVDPNKREMRILKGIQSLEETHGFKVIIKDKLLQEVRNLVEYPTVFHGQFDETYLELPADVLITTMEEHQRYFPVENGNNQLTNIFIGVRNGDDQALEQVIKGNEKVLHARLSDAKFFYEEDKQVPIHENLAKLDRVVFQEQLGSMGDKVQRVKKVTESLANLMKIDNEEKQYALRTAEISKFDLVTNMVQEFTELQGIMGEIYALHHGENSTVAQAIREHYMPLQAQSELPETIPGAIVSLADKLDTIVGFISVGLMPSGSQDPYGLRRQAIGVLRILHDQNWKVSLESIIDIVIQQYGEQGHSVERSIQEKLFTFFKQRLNFILKEMDIEPDVIESVLMNEIGILNYTINKAILLNEKRHDESFKDVQEALSRVLNLASSQKNEADKIQTDLFETDSEQQLYDTMNRVQANYAQAKMEYNATVAFNEIISLADAINGFFDNNMVMTDQKEIRLNRLALVHHIAKLINDFADLTVIQWRQHH